MKKPHLMMERTNFILKAHLASRWNCNVLVSPSQFSTLLKKTCSDGILKWCPNPRKASLLVEAAYKTAGDVFPPPTQPLSFSLHLQSALACNPLDV